MSTQLIHGDNHLRVYRVLDEGTPVGIVYHDRDDEYRENPFMGQYKDREHALLGTILKGRFRSLEEAEQAVIKTHKEKKWAS